MTGRKDGHFFNQLEFKMARPKSSVLTGAEKKALIAAAKADAKAANAELKDAKKADTAAAKADAKAVKAAAKAAVVRAKQIAALEKAAAKAAGKVDALRQ